MKKFLCIFFTVLIFCGRITSVHADVIDTYALAAVVIDGENGRILYGKNHNTPMAVASTTKIMTLITALEYGNTEDVVTISAYAASQPDVQLNAVKGEQYYFDELLHLMMLQSYNDVAVAVAEYTGGILNGDVSPNENREESLEDVRRFVDEMNRKAKEIGCKNTYFITPNGLDAEDDNGYHSSTAYDMALIGAYAVKNDKITDICTTRSFSYRELNNKRAGTVNNTDRFLDMMPGAVGLKTGYTGKAGYCFVGAVKQEGRTFISVVLGSGWPPNKSQKWTDTGKLMNYAINNYFRKVIFSSDNERYRIKAVNGTKKYVSAVIPFNISTLLCTDDTVNVLYEIPEYVIAPVKKNTQIGSVYIYINDRLEYRLPVLTSEGTENRNFMYYLKCFITEILP